MKAKDIVKFSEPADKAERESLMVVIEMRGDRVLVKDIRFADWGIPPTDVYLVRDLKLAKEAETKIQEVESA